MLYLDSDRMFSISSQLLRGMVERIYSGSHAEESESESQQGKFASGRTLANLTAKRRSETEIRDVHDFAYTLFEQELESRGFLLGNRDIESSPSRSLPSLARVTGRGTLYDAREVASMLKSFNDFGASIAYVSTFGEMQPMRHALNEKIKGSGDRNFRARARQSAGKKLSADEIAKTMGLQQDKEFLNRLGGIVEKFYDDDLELRIALDPPWHINTTLDRKHLRVQERLLTKRYSSAPAFDLTILGLITRVGGTGTSVSEYRPPGLNPEPEGHLTESDETTAPPTPNNMREGIRSMSMAIGEIEEMLFRPTDEEIIMEPIAVYYEVLPATVE